MAKHVAETRHTFWAMAKALCIQTPARLLNTLCFRNAASWYGAVIVTVIATAATSLLFAQVSGQAAAKPHGVVERIKVYGRSLQGNLEGDSPDRYVSIYLPPGYKANVNRRYPVIYFLHGFTDDDAEWYGFKAAWINLPVLIEGPGSR